MILVNIRRSGEKAATDDQIRAAAQGDWVAAEEAIERYGDRLLAVRRNVVVGVFEIRSWTRQPGGRVRFDLEPSVERSTLVGTPSPVTWKRGQSNPVAYIDDQPEVGTKADHRRVRAPASKRRNMHRIVIETKGLSDAAAADLHHALLVVASASGKLSNYQTTSLVREIQAAKDRLDYKYRSTAVPAPISAH